MSAADILTFPFKVGGKVIGGGARVAIAPFTHPVYTAKVAAVGTAIVFGGAAGLKALDDHWQDLFHGDPPEFMIGLADALGYVRDEAKEGFHLIYKGGIEPAADKIASMHEITLALRARPEMDELHTNAYMIMLTSPVVNGTITPSAHDNAAREAIKGIDGTRLNKFVEALQKTTAEEIGAKDEGERWKFVGERFAQAAKDADLTPDEMKKLATAADALGHTETAGKDPINGKGMWMASSILTALAGDKNQDVAKLSADQAEAAGKGYDAFVAAGGGKPAAKPDEDAPDPKLSFMKEEGKTSVAEQWKNDLVPKFRADVVALGIGDIAKVEGYSGNLKHMIKIEIQRFDANDYRITATTTDKHGKLVGSPASNRYSDISGVMEALKYQGDDGGPTTSGDNVVRFLNNSHDGVPLTVAAPYVPSTPTGRNALPSPLAGTLAAPLATGPLASPLQAPALAPVSYDYTTPQGRYGMATDASRRLGLGTAYPSTTNNGPINVTLNLQPTRDFPQGSSLLISRRDHSDLYDVALLDFQGNVYPPASGGKPAGLTGANADTVGTLLKTYGVLPEPAGGTAALQNMLREPSTITPTFQPGAQVISLAPTQPPTRGDMGSLRMASAAPVAQPVTFTPPPENRGSAEGLNGWMTGKGPLDGTLRHFSPTG